MSPPAIITELYRGVHRPDWWTGLVSGDADGWGCTGTGWGMLPVPNGDGGKLVSFEAGFRICWHDEDVIAV